MKKTLKIILALLTIVSITFIWQKRVYLQQLSSVVIQLIQQQYKWNQVNTGTYVYKYIDNNSFYLSQGLSPYLLFIKDKQVERAIHIRNGYDFDMLLDKKKIASIYIDSSQYHKHNLSRYLIDQRFNKIWSSLWENSFSFYLEYDEQYAYPKVLGWVWEDPVEYQKNITLDSGNTSSIFSLELKMFDADTEFTDEFLTNVLNDYKEKDLRRLKCRDGRIDRLSECDEDNQSSLMVEEIGGDIFRGVVSKDI